MNRRWHVPSLFCIDGDIHRGIWASLSIKNEKQDLQVRESR